MSLPTLATRGARLEHIDALRGLAALYVVLFHTALMPSPPLEVPGWAGGTIRAGGTGVTLFFVVSAFTLCGSMSRHEREPDAIRRYFLRRVFRIVPLFYCWVGLSLIRDWLLFGVIHDPWRVLLTLSFAYNLVPGHETSLVWAGWTLGVEVLFYLVFPSIYRHVNDVWRAGAFAVVALALAVAFRHTAILVLPPEVTRGQFIPLSILSKLPAFAFGVLAFHIYSQFVAQQRRSTLVSAILVAAGLAVMSTATWGSQQSGLPPLAFYSAAYTLLVIGLAIVPWSALVNRLTLFLGTISYSLYLAHPTVVYLLIPIYRRVYDWPTSTAVKFGSCALITIALASLISAITYRWIEQPGMRLGDRLLKRRSASDGLVATL